jgi:uncharacterized OsmC-like protein
MARASITYEGGGEDSAPTPFDIFVGSLGMCMLLFATLYMERHGLSTEGLALDIEFEMARNPNRLGKVHGILQAPNADLGQRREALVRAALACPVHHSIRDDTEVTLELAE